MGAGLDDDSDLMEVPYRSVLTVDCVGDECTECGWVVCYLSSMCSKGSPCRKFLFMFLPFLKGWGYGATDFKLVFLHTCDEVWVVLAELYFDSVTEYALHDWGDGRHDWDPYVDEPDCTALLDLWSVLDHLNTSCDCPGSGGW